MIEVNSELRQQYANQKSSLQHKHGDQTICIRRIDGSKYIAIIGRSYLATAVGKGLCSDFAVPLRVGTAPDYHR
jgi:hypothetical protein